MPFSSNIDSILERSLIDYNNILLNKDYMLKKYITKKNTISDYILFLDKIIGLHEQFIALLKKSAHIPNLRKDKITIN